MFARAAEAALAAFPGSVPVEAVDGQFVAVLAAGGTQTLTFFGPYPRVYHGLTLGTDNTVARSLVGVRMRRDNGRYVVGSPTDYVSAGSLVGGDVVCGVPSAISPTYSAARQNWVVELTNRGAAAVAVAVDMWFTEFVQPGEAT